MREIPPVKYDKDVERLASYYQRSHLRVTEELVRLLETESWSTLVQQEASLARQLQLIMHENDTAIHAEVDALITKSHVAGQAQALLALGEALTLADATRQVSMSMFAQKSAEKMVQDTFEDVLAMTSRTDKKIKQTVREVSGEVLRMNAMNQSGLTDSRKAIMNQLLKKGFSKKITENFKGVTDSAGRKWVLKTYVNMLTKTKISQSYSEGVRAECVERGIDLAMISSHGAKDACRHFEGMVISMNGSTAGYLTYDQLRNSNKIFHPNCEHTITPLRSIELLPPALQAKHKEMMEKVKKSKILS